MKRPVYITTFFISIVSTLLVLSCNNAGTDKNVVIDSVQWNIDTVLADNDSLLNGILGNTYETIDVDSSDYAILPLAAPRFDREGAESTKFYGSSSYKEGNGSNYWNLIFYNEISRQSHLLDTNKQFIHSIHVNNKESYGYYAGKYILYDITRKDFNGNGLLDYDDPQYLFISDLEGRNLKQISPDNAHVVSWAFPKKSNFLIVKFRYDMNKDRLFDGNDATAWIRVDIDSTIKQTPLLLPSFEEEMKRLFKKQYSKQPDSKE